MPEGMVADRQREKRNELLKGSDWTQSIDAPVDQAVWAKYRQTLRDMPDDPRWPYVDFPEPPRPPGSGDRLYLSMRRFKERLVDLGLYDTVNGQIQSLTGQAGKKVIIAWHTEQIVRKDGMIVENIRKMGIADRVMNEVFK